MPLKNVLVALDGAPQSETALRAGIAIQKSYDAHLTGIVSGGDGIAPSAAENTWIPAAIMASLRKTQNDAISQIEAKFRQATAGLDASHVHLVQGGQSSVAEASRFFDATLIGIPERGAGGSGLHPDRIALLSGRPVIAFPAGVDADRVASKVMIAWDGSRAAARSLSSAFRLLDTKDDITIVTVGGPGTARPDEAGLDPQSSLRRQGLRASWIDTPRASGGIAATLLAQADRLGADLIVMGAFEHSKFREDLFGGVTHDVMAQTRIPVFLAH
ncbi:universal stress protein [Paracoccus sp. (in: a-proteobacteria)]|uniref:universal stress protein n=1 Tax=Paracoccus sp. TaxID=267 RepID=UPI003A85F045